MRRIMIPAVAGLALVGVAACSPDEADFASEAESFIEDEDDDVATEMGMTFSDADCEEPSSTDVGTTFSCNAVGDDGNTYVFTASIDGERSFQITGVTMDDGAATGATTASTDSDTTAGTAVTETTAAG